MSRHRAAICGTAAVTLAATASWLYQSLAERRDRRRFPPPGVLVDIGGRQVHVLKAGTQAPTIIVLPALGSVALEWVRVQRALSELTDATIYLVDRGGLGWSDPAPWPRTPHTMADEVDQLIVALGITGPTVVVGHSIGGLTARLYAARHRGRVAGLVLVDSSHEDQRRVLHRFDPSVGVHELWVRAVRYQLRPLGLARLLAARSKAAERREAEREVPAELVEAYLARRRVTARRRAVVQEFLGFAHGMASVRAEARDLGDLPVWVVTAGPAHRSQWHEGWLELQKDFLGMSTNSTQVWATHCSHRIDHEDPELLARILRDAINAVGSGVSQGQAEA